MREFRLQISNTEGKKISFGKRMLGSAGRDIIAVKHALGVIVAPEDLPNQSENLNTVDPNNWLDCTTGGEISPQQAATFDKSMQLRLMKFQLDNQLLIMSYLFHKFGINKLIGESIELGSFDRQISDAIEGIFKRSSTRKIEYDDLSAAGKRLLYNQISLDVVSKMGNLFTGELGMLDEATLAVLHGWTPQTRYGNLSYYHEKTTEGSESVIDIIPLEMFNQFLRGDLTQKPRASVEAGIIDAPDLDIAGGVDVFRNNADDLRAFNKSAPESYRWSPQDGFEYATIKYTFRPQRIEENAIRKSALYDGTLATLEAIVPPEPGQQGVGITETRELIERVVQPDPLTDPDPFIIDSNRIGFFDHATLEDGTPFTVDNMSSWIATKNSPATILRLEDIALRKVLQYYDKPDFWYVYRGSPEMEERYFVPGAEDNPSPEREALTLPHDKEESDRLKYWVLGTNVALTESNNIQSNAIQHYSSIEGNNIEAPLIKFVEYRVPSFRPGDPYRVYFEINKEKLDLITQGYVIAEQESEEEVTTQNSNTDTLNSLAEQLTAICEDLPTSENDRRYEEYRALAAKNRREIVRRIREATMQAHQSSSAMHTLDLELGNVLGPALEDTPFGQYLGPFGNMELSDGRYAQHLAGAIGSVASAIGTGLTNANIDAAGSAPGTPVQPDTSTLTTLNINWVNLKNRVDIITKDLKEAKKHAAQEAFIFDPSNFDPVTEGKNLDRIITKIESMIRNAQPDWPGFDESNSFLSSTPVLSPLSDADTNVIINFAFIDNDGITETRILSIKTQQDIYELPTDETKEPQEFLKPIAIGYLSQAYKMTTSWTGQMEPQVAKDPSGCADLGAVKNGVAYLVKYSFGLKAKKDKKGKKAKAWHDGWGDRNFKKPLNEWLAKSDKNIQASFDPKNFGQDEVLGLIGETCTWPKIYKEFLDKVDLKMLLCDYLKCVGLPGIAIKAPSINIPPVPKMRIFGWYVGFVLFLKKRWKEIITRLLCTIVRMLIDFLTFPLCDEQFKEAFGNAGQYSPVVKQALSDALFRLPLQPGDEDKAKDFVDDAFRTLRGDEICRLLNGELLDGAAMAMLERLAEHRGLQTSFTSRESILEFFSVISGFVPSSLCERLNGLDDIAGGATCKDSVDKLEVFRARFEANDDVTPEQVAEALEMAHKNLMDNETAMQALLDNGLAKMAGNYLEIGNPDALINSLPDTINKSIERTAKFTFERSKMAYTSTLSAFVPGLSIVSTRLSQPGDEKYDAQAVIKIETALRNLQVYQDLTETGDFTNPEDIDQRFLALYQVYEAEYLNGHIVHSRFTPGTETKIPFADVALQTRQTNNPDNFPQLRQLSYSKQLTGLLNPSEGEESGLYDPQTGAPMVIDTSNYETFFVGSRLLNYPHRREVRYKNTATGAWAFSGTQVDNIEYIPDGDAREGYDLPDTNNVKSSSRKTWTKLDNTWLDDNLPDWVTFSSLESTTAKEMFMLNRVQELTDIIAANISAATGTESNTEYMHILKEMYDASIEAVREGTSAEQIEMDSLETLRMQADLGPFRPSVSLKEYTSNENRDSFLITVNDRFLFPEAQSIGEVFEYCDMVPPEFLTNQDGEALNTLENSYAKRTVFGQHVLNMVGKDLNEYGFSDIEIPSSIEALVKPFSGPKTGDTGGSSSRSLYKLSFEGILESVFFKLKDSRMFDETYAAGLHDRLSGRYELETGCVSNKYNLNHFGILSFDEMILDELPDLVTHEMSRPENQPQNLDYNMPGPIEKAIQVACFKGLVRVCLIEMMLKGAIPYSVWDMEAVAGEQFYIDYTNRYVLRQIESHDSIRDFWRPIAEKIAGISGAQAALRKIIKEELMLMPDLSKLVFDNREESYGPMEFLLRDGTIPNTGVPRAYESVRTDHTPSGYSPKWRSQHAMRANPFLSVEHYIKMSGSLADLRNAIPDPVAAATAVTDTFDTLTYTAPNGEEQTIHQLVSGLSPFSNITRSVQDITTTEFDNSVLNTVPAAINPILDDNFSTSEIYHIEEIATVFEAINTRVSIFDDHVAPSFGFISDNPTTPEEARLAAEVLRRTPARFIRRKRKIVKLKSNESFDPRKQNIQDLVSLEPYAYNELMYFGHDEITNDIGSQVSDQNAIKEEDDRFYIIPVDYWASTSASGTKSILGIDNPAESLQDPTRENQVIFDSAFYRGWTTKVVGIDNKKYDLLDPAAPWMSLNNPNDLVTKRQSSGALETLFMNPNGEVTESIFNSTITTLNNPEWREDNRNMDVASEETWLETVIDFVGDASIIFTNPGESFDSAIETWASLEESQSAAAWSNLKEYLNENEIEEIRSNNSKMLITNRDTQLGHVDKHICPGQALGHSLTEDFNLYGVLMNKIPHDTYAQSGQPVRRGGRRERAEIFGINDAIDSALSRNDYRVPLRMLVTQIQRGGAAIEEVYSRVVIPRVLSSIRTAPEEDQSYRRIKLDAALAQIFTDYTTMIEEAYIYLVQNDFSRIENANPTPNEKYNEVLHWFTRPIGTGALLRHKLTFPVLLRTENLAFADEENVHRPSFYSISKLYSVASDSETKDPTGAFSDNSEQLDELFSDRGLLMKRSNVQLDTLPKYYGTTTPTWKRGIVEQYKANTRRSEIEKLEAAEAALMGAADFFRTGAGALTTRAIEALQYLRPDSEYTTDIDNKIIGLLEANQDSDTDWSTHAEKWSSLYLPVWRSFFTQMRYLFTGGINVGGDQLAGNAPNSQSCNIIGTLLDLVDNTGGSATWHAKLQSIPEPFRSAVSIGCFNSAGVWGDHADPSIAFDQITIDVDNITESQETDFVRFLIKIYIMQRSSVYRTWRLSHDSRDQWHLEDTAAAHFYNNDLIDSWAAEAQVHSTGEVAAAEEMGRLYGGAVQDAADEWAGELPDAQDALTWALDKMFHYMMAYTLADTQRQLTFLRGVDAGMDERSNYTLGEESPLWVGVAHAMDLKRDQRLGMNYLYDYNLHTFFAPGNNFSLNGARGDIPKKERCNKIALSVANILTWYSQNRSESFPGMTSHPHVVVDKQRKVQTSNFNKRHFKPMETPARQSAEGYDIPQSAETPGVMCGFSPFIGDGRFHIEEFIEAYKQYFLSINGVSEASFDGFVSSGNLEQSVQAMTDSWAPKINFLWFISEFLEMTLDRDFLAPDAQGSDIDRETATLAGGQKMYLDFKYGPPFLNEIDDSADSTANVKRSVGVYIRPSDKHANLRRVMLTYKREAEKYLEVLKTNPPENQPGPGLFGTQVFIDTEVPDVVFHLISSKNLSAIKSSGFHNMTPSMKVFLYHSKYTNRLDSDAAGIRQSGDHWISTARATRNSNPTMVEHITPQITLIQDNLFHEGASTENPLLAGFVAFEGFGKGHFPGVYNRTNFRVQTAGNMLSQQWQCLLEDTGLFYFYERYRGIFAENLYAEVEELLLDADIKDCSRLMLNIPSQSPDANTGPITDFELDHPMRKFLEAFKAHLAAAPDTRLDLDPAFMTISSEERAYRVQNSSGQGYTYSLPLSKFEDGQQFSLSGHGGNVQAMVNAFDIRKNDRTQALLSNHESKTVLEYIFPIQRYMSMATVYSTSILGGFNEVPNLMMSTKASLAMVLHLCSINARARLDFLENVSQSEMMKKAQDNMLGAGDSAMSCFDFPFNEDMMKQFWEQLKDLVRQIPSIILRGIADVLDPAYKEMKIHYNSCEIKHLRNSGWTSNAFKNYTNVESGLIKGPNRRYDQGGRKEAGNGQYVPIIPGAIVDNLWAAGLMAMGCLALNPLLIKIAGKEFRNSILRTLSYVYKGPASLIDPSMAFKMPCMDQDLDFAEKWNHGEFGRYGHPITPFSLLALMTPEINAEREQKAANCPPGSNAIPPPICEDDEV